MFFLRAVLAALCFQWHLIAMASVNRITCGGRNYTYEGLAGYGLIPSNARDKYGDTIGGIGSAIVIDRQSWSKTAEGNYTGVLWALPDRGWYCHLKNTIKDASMDAYEGSTGTRKELSIIKVEYISF